MLSPQELDQRMAALAKGNMLRTDRSVLKAQVAEGRISPLEILDDPPEHALRIPVEALLRASGGLGRVKAERILKLAGVTPTRRVGELTPRQIAEVHSAFERYCPVIYRRWAYGAVA